MNASINRLRSKPKFLPMMKIQSASKFSIVYQMRRTACVIGVLGLLSSVPALSYAAEGDFAARVDRVLAGTPLIDGHNDLAEQLHDRANGSFALIDLQSDNSRILSTN